jgi:protein-S-isoprenylcysteine O-methyltransferase Ste14
MDAMQICGDLWIALGIIWLVGVLRTKPTQERTDLGSRLAYRVFTVLAYVLIFGKRVIFPEWLLTRLFARAEWIDVLGIALTALGVGFAVWARIYLGQNWSSAVTIKVGHELMRAGPYAWVRHPIYSGLLLAMLGTGLVRGEVRGAVAFVVLLTGFWMKLGREERFMRKTFGAEYEEYARRTGALVPKFRG